jgi:two-component system cell cycle response regulator
VIDPLTGLYNRRYAFQHLNGISERASSEGQLFSILMMDLDEFKSVNDLYGHPSGDEVLCEFSRRLQENLRGIDLVSRIGGEEFLVAMPGTDQVQAAIVAERLRMAIETKPFLLSDFNDQVSVTVSIGVAASSPIDTNPSLIMKNADTALYLAKNDGRNAVKIFCDAA